MSVPEGSVLRIALVSCGKAKVKHPAPAAEFYTGSLFRAARRHAETGYDAWWILSAKHHLVHPQQILAPYDATLGNFTDEQVRQWANRVDSEFRIDAGYGTWVQQGGGLVVDIYAGKNYVQPLLATPAWRRPWCDVNLPHEGLQIGERLQAFAQARGAE